jgi:DNA-binding NarL/FixJ family response regulator
MGYSVIAYSDEPMSLAGVQALVQVSSTLKFIAGCVTRAEVLASAREHQPDVILYSLALDSDLTGIREILKESPRSAIVLWSREFAPELVHQAVAMGARGFLSTTANASSLRDCLLISAGGELWMENSLSMILLNARPVNLSKRQMELLELLVQGLKNKEIAAQLGISEGTVKAYLTTMFEKVGAKDRFELALFGLKKLRNVREASRGMESRKAAASAGSNMSHSRHHRTVA